MAENTRLEELQSSINNHEAELKRLGDLMELCHLEQRYLANQTKQTQTDI